MATKREFIANIKVDKANLEHIAKTGVINGSLLIDIEKAMEDYHVSQLNMRRVRVHANEREDK